MSGIIYCGESAGLAVVLWGVNDAKRVSRQVAWTISEQAQKSDDSDYLHWLRSLAFRIHDDFKHIKNLGSAGLDALEIEYFNQIKTTGTHSKRLGFWSYVALSQHKNYQPVDIHRNYRWSEVSPCATVEAHALRVSELASSLNSAVLSVKESHRRDYKTYLWYYDVTYSETSVNPWSFKLNRTVPPRWRGKFFGSSINLDYLLLKSSFKN